MNLERRAIVLGDVQPHAVSIWQQRDLVKTVTLANALIHDVSRTWNARDLGVGANPSHDAEREGFSVEGDGSRFGGIGVHH